MSYIVAGTHMQKFALLIPHHHSPSTSAGTITSHFSSQARPEIKNGDSEKGVSDEYSREHAAETTSDKLSLLPNSKPEGS